MHPDPDGRRRRPASPRSRRRPRQTRKQARRRFSRRWLVVVASVLLTVSGLVPVALLHLIDPPRTAFMLGAAQAARERGAASYTTDYRPVALAEISPWVALAVITSEDQKFPTHRGFDVAAIQQALETHREGGRLRGASTLSQQVAKNLFLWPGRSWLRKALEAWYTLVLELLLPKTRILELHLNIAEYGPGVYGVEAAAQRYFDRSAATLERRQAALLATVLPNPLRHRLSAPDPAMRRRQTWILDQMERLGGLHYLDRLAGR